MSKKIQLLDCTLRDGAYIVDANFGTPAIKGIIKKMQDANVDIIECGWLKNNPHKEGTSFYHVPQDLERYLLKRNDRTTYVVMIDWDRYDLEYLPVCDGNSIDAIRVVFPYGKFKEGIAVGRAIKEKGYKVFFQAANTLGYSNEDLVELAKEINAVMPVSLSIVDTFGAMYEEDLERIVRTLDSTLDKNIKIGFHSHNNQQLSFSLSMHFVELLKESERNCIVDASLCGMGRGAGNATTELVASYLNRKQHGNYDMNQILDAIDTYMEYFKEHYSWGYSTPYFIAGMYCCHVNNIAYLQKNHRTNAKDMRSIIESLSAEDRKVYDYDLLEQKYMDNQNRIVDDESEIEKLRELFKGREILLIAPGKSSLSGKHTIDAYIKEKNPLVIGVNAVVPGYDYDYLFIMNATRYDYAKDIYPEQFQKAGKILLSNVKTEPDADEIIVNFNCVIKRGWEHFDNAVINCLRLMASLYVDRVAIAGFDGFKHSYNESYADIALPTLNPDNKWDELNEEIQDMFHDLKMSVAGNMEILFLTESIFE
ncbi:MAG: aldolase catalytic domain-containing protein [Clostridiales bacterium]|nr:aldolase catalytic domain-containing protein [Clostridiales bacterium]